MTHLFISVNYYLRKSYNSDTIEVHIRSGGRFRVRIGLEEGAQWWVGRSRAPTLMDLTVGYFKVGRYLKWRQREGPAIGEEKNLFDE